MAKRAYKEFTLSELPSVRENRSFLVIDILTELEQQIVQNPLEEAINIPLHDEELVERESFLEEVQAHIRKTHRKSLDVRVAFICRSGECSERACEIVLNNTQYKSIYNVKGGMLV